MRLSTLPRAAVTFACFQMEEKKKKKYEQPVRTDYWLQPNIVVKVITKKLGERYHKKKAVVMVTRLFFFFSLMRGQWRESRLFLFLSHLD